MTLSSQYTTTNNAFVTLLTSDHYLPGALVLAESLRLSHALPKTAKLSAGVPRRTSALDFQVVALITPQTLSVQSIKALRRSGLFDWIVGVEPIGFQQILASSIPAGSSSALHANPIPSTMLLNSDLNQKVLEMQRNLSLLGRPDLTNTLTKLHAWRLGHDSAHLIAQVATPAHGTAQVWQGFDKVVFLDADALVLRPVDHLFSLDTSIHFAAAPDTGWPDAFNSGVMMLTPSSHTFEAIRSFARTTGSWDGADQGLLNDFFGPEQGSTYSQHQAQEALTAPGGGWKRLSFRYNVTSHGGYTFAPAYQRYGQSINVVHFIGQNKPWNRPRPSGTAQPNPLVGPRDLDAQPITPDQPDYLLSLWHSAFASLYPTSGSASPDSEIEVVHTERGVEVVERRNFTVPTFHAVWDAEARDKNSSIFPFNPQHSASNFSEANHHSAWEAAYASLPLDGRTSLIAPSPEVERSPSPPTPTQELIDAELQTRTSSSTTHPATPAPAAAIPIVISQSADKADSDSEESIPHFSPPKLSWNPAREPPPVGSDASLHQMRTPIDTFYSNVWDAGQKTPQTLAEQKAAFFIPQNAHVASTGKRGTVVGGPGYIPPQLRRDRVFDNLGSHKPDPSKVKPIFPWESQPQASAPAPTRVFPDEPRTSPPSSADTTPKVSQNAKFQQSSGPQPVPVRPRQRGLPATLSFVNAWDQAGAIGNFANSWNRKTQPASPSRSRALEVQAGRNSSRDPSDSNLRRSPTMSFRPMNPAPVERRMSAEEVGSNPGEGEASDSRDGDDESSSGGESSGNEESVQVLTAEVRGSTPSPANSRQGQRQREGPGKGYMRKAEHSIHAQMHATPRSPRMTSRVLGYVSTATEGEGRSGGKFSSSSSSTRDGSSTMSNEGASARQRARDRIRPDGWISTGSTGGGSGMSSPPKTNPYYSATTSLRGIPGIGGGVPINSDAKPSPIDPNAPCTATSGVRPILSANHQYHAGPGGHGPLYTASSRGASRRKAGNTSSASSSGTNSPTALLSPSFGVGFSMSRNTAALMTRGNAVSSSASGLDENL
ncbi:related to glycogenin-2 beta [Melanopsichium pennsylvanicum]|uniref:Related to glycogenin-2 beta n=2 Tax=Melanopsichium pennsylvanicum TaxID=63383 RepID=A0AAJ4XJZ6_9BASI|nr:related to glycogenin-2 beta [Melanopsichium pennsylvanicum 4]SNX82493.1 related to glycogenin-2 beta [Melanopsichium pennsylvanicum]